jgi:hypothetical protein
MAAPLFDESLVGVDRSPVEVRPDERIAACSRAWIS